jgi:hypothetical protein
MAEITENQASEQRNPTTEEKYREELSAKTYGFKKVRELAIGLGTTLIGSILGGIAGKTGEQKDISLMGTPVSKPFLGSLIGATIGSMVGGIVMGYEHWRNMERERLGVKEINEDVANMKIRERTSPELVKENERLREMLATEEQRTARLQSSTETPAEKIVKAGARPPIERTQTAAQTGLAL